MSSEMLKEIQPTGPVHARVLVPGSKSLTNRALVCAALAKGESLLRNPSASDDSALMVNGLNQLGVLVRPEADCLRVYGRGGALFAPKFPIPVGNAGTTARFLLALSSLAEGRVVIEGSERMAERPMEELLGSLRSLGVKCDVEAHGARYAVAGGSLEGGRVVVRADRSSQFMSGLLLVAPYARADLVIEAEGPVASAAYIDLTVDVMKAFGVDVALAGTGTFIVRAGQRYQPTEYPVEADTSGASYIMAAAAVTGGDVEIPGISSQSRQGDIGFIEILRAMGCSVGETAGAITVQGPASLQGVLVDLNRMPDIVPTLAAVALFAQGMTTIRNVGHLRYKESDRLDTLATELRKLGARIAVLDDGLQIEPAQLHGAELDTHDDHRLAMSFAVIGLRVPGVRITRPECVRKSFPSFWEEFSKLGTPGE